MFILLTKKEKFEILKYHTEVCLCVIEGRKESQRIPAGNWIVWATKRFEGHLDAIRQLVDLLGLPKDFLPNRNSIIV